VLIRDTLSPYLDITTVQPGASSHPYQFNIGSNVLEWRLENIFLPDSASNELGSRGFVNFRVAQEDSNIHGTLIENNAAISFDYTDQSITNTALNRVGQPMNLLAETQDKSCNRSSDGSIDLLVFGGLDPFIFTWSNGETTEDLQGLDAGIYGVTVIDANGDTATLNDTVLAPPPLQIAVDSVIHESCQGCNDGGIFITVSGGTGAYQLHWSTGDTTDTLNGLSYGTYYVTITDENGCSTMDSAEVYLAVSRPPYRQSNPEVNVFPNPFHKGTTVALSRKLPEFDLEIYDQAGMRVKTIHARNTNKVVLKRSQLSSGMYFYKVKHKSMLLHTGKLIVGY